MLGHNMNILSKLVGDLTTRNATKNFTEDSASRRHDNFWKTIWISDVHLGSTQCDAEALLDFLKHNHTEKLFLVGDILDIWAMRSKLYWPSSHSTVVQKILRMARHGVEVIYIPGNHDEFIRNNFVGLEFGDKGKNIVIKESDVHVALDGKKYLIVHGDEFDGIAKYAKWLAKFGSKAYDFLLDLNRFHRFVQKFFGGGRPSFSLSAYLKYKVKNAVQFISDYEESIVAALKNEKVDGVICGHIHHPELKEIDGFVYANDGDWVESLTALVEDFDGKLRIIDWKPEFWKHHK